MRLLPSQARNGHVCLVGLPAARSATEAFNDCPSRVCGQVRNKPHGYFPLGSYVRSVKCRKASAPAPWSVWRLFYPISDKSVLAFTFGAVQRLIGAIEQDFW